MKTDTSGQWWDRSWNVVRGCSPVGEGCRNCWACRLLATRLKHRFPGFAEMTVQLPTAKEWAGDTPLKCLQPRWTGRVELVESMLEAPPHWREPQAVAVSLMGDLFHENLAATAPGRVFGVMAEAWWHTFVVLTKRWRYLYEWSKAVMHYPSDRPQRPVRGWPPNVILGASAWDQGSADEACRRLLQTPAAKRVLCLEPLLSAVDLTEFPIRDEPMHLPGTTCSALTGDIHIRRRPDEATNLIGFGHPRLSWVIVGPETGPGARPCEWGWIRGVVRQCQAAGVPCWVKVLMDPKGRRLPFEQWPVDLRVRQRPEVNR